MLKGKPHQAVPCQHKLQHGHSKIRAAKTSQEPRNPPFQVRIGSKSGQNRVRTRSGGEGFGGVGSRGVGPAGRAFGSTPTGFAKVDARKYVLFVSSVPKPLRTFQGFAPKRTSKNRQRVSKIISTLFDKFRAAPIFWPLGGSDLLPRERLAFFVRHLSCMQTIAIKEFG